MECKQRFSFKETAKDQITISLGQHKRVQKPEPEPGPGTYARPVLQSHHDGAVGDKHTCDSYHGTACRPIESIQQDEYRGVIAIVKDAGDIKLFPTRKRSQVIDGRGGPSQYTGSHSDTECRKIIRILKPHRGSSEHGAGKGPIQQVPGQNLWRLSSDFGKQK